MLPIHVKPLQQWLCGIGLLGLLFSMSATAAVQTIIHGKDLMISCQQALTILEKDAEPQNDTDANDAFVCMAYLGGVMSTAQHANELAKLRYAQATNGRGDQHNFKLYCFDWQLPYKTYAQIVLAFGRKQPAYLQQAAHKLAIRALQNTFPCR